MDDQPWGKPGGANEDLEVWRGIVEAAVEWRRAHRDARGGGSKVYERRKRRDEATFRLQDLLDEYDRDLILSAEGDEET